MGKTISPILWLIVSFMVLSGCEAGKEDGDLKPLQLIIEAPNLIPAPVSFTPGETMFVFSDKVAIYFDDGNEEAERVSRLLAGMLAPLLGVEPDVLAVQVPPSAGNIYLTISTDDESDSPEGYRLVVASDSITITATQPQGLFRGATTLSQLVPTPENHDGIDSSLIAVSGAAIVDYPTYSYRGVMLDVARHFFTVEEVLKLIDLFAFYKINYFHLHLTDDQGWRIEIDSWPELTLIGGLSEVGGGEGGYYTKDDYRRIIEYAAERFITVIPEIDLPGHTNAALASYAELNCDDVAPDLYEGIMVGFSSLCLEKEITYQFVDDVIGEVAEMTPGPYIHIGGDEAKNTPHDQFIDFIEKTEEIVRSHGKTMIGWEEVYQADLDSSSVVQIWLNGLVEGDLAVDAPVILSPASRTYLDMKYDMNTPVGTFWAGFIDLRTAYDWDLVEEVGGIDGAAVLGIEAPLWTETVETIEDVELLIFPRLAGYAEIGWTPTDLRSFDDYRKRLAAHGPKLDFHGVNYYRSPLIDWE
jgi:hexosaminidase